MFRKFFINVLVFSFILVLLSCGAKGSTMTLQDFNEMCRLYEDVAKKPTEFAMRESLIVEDIQTRWPKFFDQYFVRIMDVGRSARYDAIVRVAQHELGESSSWGCEVIKDYYDGKFDRISDVKNQ